MSIFNMNIQTALSAKIVYKTVSGKSRFDLGRSLATINATTIHASEIVGLPQPKFGTLYQVTLPVFLFAQHCMQDEFTGVRCDLFCLASDAELGLGPDAGPKVRLLARSTLPEVNGTDILENINNEWCFVDIDQNTTPLTRVQLMYMDYYSLYL